MKNRPLINASFVALLLIPFLYILNSYSPPPEKAPLGYNSTIIAFEMVSNENELKEVLEPLTQDEVKGLDKLNYVDFGFMLTYGFFLWLYATLLGKNLSLPYLLKVRWLSAIVVLADVIENIQLLKLSSYMNGGLSGIDSSITQLAIFTWIKWLLLAVIFVAIGYALLKLKGYSKPIGAILCVPLLLGIVAFITKQPTYEDTFATSVFGSFFLLTMYGFFYNPSDPKSVLSR